MGHLTFIEADHGRDFMKKEDLPASAYDYVWVRVNPSELYHYGSAATREALTATRLALQESQPRPEGIKRSLPLNKSVVMEFTPNKSGEFSFTCGMECCAGK